MPPCDGSHTCICILYGPNIGWISGNLAERRCTSCSHGFTERLHGNALTTHGPMSQFVLPVWTPLFESGSRVQADEDRASTARKHPSRTPHGAFCAAVQEGACG